MHHCSIVVRSIPGSPYSSSRRHETPWLDRETADAYDLRTWPEYCTTNKEGQVCIPAMAFKQGMSQAAFKLGEKPKGRRGATYKGFFESGLLVDGDVAIFCDGKPLTKKDAEMVAIYANPSGQRGGSKQVLKRYPVFHKWEGTVELTVLDDILEQAVIDAHARALGMIVGVGRFRPEKGGTNGRFSIIKLQWKRLELAQAAE